MGRVGTRGGRGRMSGGMGGDERRERDREDEWGKGEDERRQGWV